MNVGREVGEVISINTQTLSWASKSFSNSLFSFFIADCLSPSVSVKCPYHCYMYISSCGRIMSLDVISLAV